MQVYISTSVSEHTDALRRCLDCIAQIREWLANNRLTLNEDKTQIMWLGTRQQLSNVTTQTLTLSNACVQFSDTVNDLGVIIDSQLTMADHITAVNRACFYQRRQLRTIRKCLAPETTRMLVQPFMGSQLDYDNSLLVGLSAQLLQRLQVMQNAAACLVTVARKYDHISPILQELHWLPVRKRITFKLTVLVLNVCMA